MTLVLAVSSYRQTKRLKNLLDPLHSPHTDYNNKVQVNALKHDVYSLGITYYFMLSGYDNFVKSWSTFDPAKFRTSILSYQWAKGIPLTQDHKTIFESLLHKKDNQRWSMANLKKIMPSSKILKVSEKIVTYTAHITPIKNVKM